MRDLDESYFSKNIRSSDGLQSTCKNCFARYNRLRYIEKGDEIRAKVSEYRKNNPSKIKENKRKWKKTEAGKAAQRRYESGTGRETRRKAKLAKEAVRRAVKKGFLLRGKCEKKGNDCHGEIEAHHHLGYEKQYHLCVKWLCKHHHRKIHEMINKKQ